MNARRASLLLAAVMAVAAAASGCGGGSGDGSSTAGVSGPMAAGEAKKVLDPIVARLEAGGYGVAPRPPYAGITETGTTFSANVTVWATPAAAKGVGAALAQTPRVTSGIEDVIVIGTREYTASKAADPKRVDTAEPLRRLVGVAEGCGPNCAFSVSTAK